MNEFIFGFLHPFRCTGLFFRFPKLIAYSIVPMVINLVIYGTIFFYVYGWIMDTAAGKDVFALKDGFVFDTLRFLVKAAALLLVLLLCYFLFVIFGGIISAPFNEFISKHVEERKFGVKSSAELPFFKEVAVSIREELKKLLFYFSVMIPLFAVNFVPMIGSVVSIAVGTPFSFYYNALDFLDYPMTRHGAVFRTKLRTVNSKLLTSMGFGAISFLLMFIPVVNVIFKPLLVVAGTDLYHLKNYILQNKT
ncbi:MAG: EI24 domain-containing protein [Ignavibacteria bacterium]|nr:EI24 domain-containing protein [Ignavibacteria bacterium]